jgi:hypothetical protein
MHTHMHAHAHTCETFSGFTRSYRHRSPARCADASVLGPVEVTGTAGAGTDALLSGVEDQRTKGFDDTAAATGFFGAY